MTKHTSIADVSRLLDDYGNACASHMPKHAEMLRGKIFTAIGTMLRETAKAESDRVAPSPVAERNHPYLQTDEFTARAAFADLFAKDPVLAQRKVATLLAALTAPSPAPSVGEVEALRALVATMENVAEQAYEHWDADRDAKVGKILGALAAADGQPSSAPIRTTAQGYTPYRVREDMGRADLTIVVEEDGDVIVGIARDGFRSEAQFCTPGSGGGKSPLVHAALRNLANAVASSTADGQRGEG
jgi:hypothetical protein